MPAQPDEQARITSRKIDAIECEMSAEFSTGMSMALPASAKSSASVGVRQTIEEAALLHSSDQSTSARALLTSAILIGNALSNNKLAWRMLLEIHEVAGDQSAFEQVAVAYARQFETSPPAWQSNEATGSLPDNDSRPVISFRGKLNAGCRPMLEQLFQLGCRHRRFCLDFVSIAEVDFAGCRALLHTLDAWREQACEVNLQQADALIEKIRTLIQPGRRDADDTGWRLLIECLWLTQATAAYENACVDYSITYEVSPPVPRSSPCRLPTAGARPADGEFVMPARISLPVDDLLKRIALLARSHDRIVLDGAALQRVDFNAAAPLMTGLRQLADTKPVELRHARFLVSILLQLVGGESPLKIINRKT